MPCPVFFRSRLVFVSPRGTAHGWRLACRAQNHTTFYLFLLFIPAKIRGVYLRAHHIYLPEFILDFVNIPADCSSKTTPTFGESNPSRASVTQLNSSMLSREVFIYVLVFIWLVNNNSNTQMDNITQQRLSAQEYTNLSVSRRVMKIYRQAATLHQS